MELNERIVMGSFIYCLGLREKNNSCFSLHPTDNERFLCFKNGVNWTYFHTGPAFRTLILIDNVFLFTFVYGICRTFLGTGSTGYAFIIDLVRHRYHLLSFYISIISFSFSTITSSICSMNLSVSFWV